MPVEPDSDQDAFGRVTLRLGRLLGRAAGHRFADIGLYRLNGDRQARPLVITKMRGGYSVAVPTADHHLRHAVLTGHWEPDVEGFARAVLRPGDSAIDVGANVGFHTLTFASAVGAEGAVLSFEPGTTQRRFLERSIELNGWSGIVSLRKVALGASPQVDAVFHDGPGVGLTSSLLRHVQVAVTGASAVTVSTLDVEIQGWRVDQRLRLLKIDVEGSELDVLAGAQQVFSERAPAFLIAEFGALADNAALMSAITQLGYEPVQLIDDAIVPRDMNLSDLVGPAGADYFYANVFFRRVTAQDD